MSNADDQLAMVRRLQLRNERLEAEVDRLKGSDGGGTLPPMDTIDAKIAASEARTDTKFAELRGDLAKFATKGTVWGAMATALGVVLTLAAFGSDRFDAGMTVKDAVDATVTGQKAHDAAQDRKLDEILSRLPERDRIARPR